MTALAWREGLLIGASSDGTVAGWHLSDSECAVSLCFHIVSPSCFIVHPRCFCLQGPHHLLVSVPPHYLCYCLCANISVLCLFHVGTTRGDLALRGAFKTDGPVRAMVWDSAGKDGLVMTAAGTIWCVRPGKVTDS